MQIVEFDGAAFKEKPTQPVVLRQEPDKAAGCGLDVGRCSPAASHLCGSAGGNQLTHTSLCRGAHPADSYLSAADQRTVPDLYRYTQDTEGRRCVRGVGRP